MVLNKRMVVDGIANWGVDAIGCSEKEKNEFSTLKNVLKLRMEFELDRSLALVCLQKRRE